MATPSSEPATTSGASPAFPAQRDDTPYVDIFNVSPVGLMLTAGADGSVLELNEAMCQLFGYRRDELVGRQSVEELNLWGDPAEREAVMALMRRDGQVRDYESTYRTRSGELRNVRMCSRRIIFSGVECILSSAVDITEAKRTEAALARSETNHRALFDNMPSAMAHCKVLFEGETPVDYEFVQVNRAFTMVSRLEVRAGLRATDLGATFEPERAQALSVYERVATSGSPVRWEQYVERLQGWLSHTIYSPAPGEVVVVSEDVTQRKRSQEEVAEGRSLLQAALHSMTDAVAIFGRDGKLIDFNDSFVTFHRFTDRSSCAQMLVEYPPRFLDVRWLEGTPVPHEQWPVPRALRGETGTDVEFRLRRNDTGEEWIASYNYAPVRDARGEIASAVVTGRDVTVQKRIEDEVRTLSLIVEQSAESVIVTDTLGRIEYVNGAFTRKSGYDRNEVLGRTPTFLSSDRNDVEALRALTSALRAGNTWRGDAVKRRKDGSEYVVQAVVSPILMADGHVGHYAAVTDDVTHRRQTEAELHRHRHHLEAIVAQRTTELEVAKSEAEAATRAKSAFLAHMSHEVRTPLNAVLGVAQMGLRDSRDPKTNEAFHRILESGRLLLSVLNDILDLSKIEALKLECEILPVRPRQIADELVATWAAAAQAKGLEFRCVFDPQLPEAFLSDPVRLAQILSNLASNAIKFTTKGSITLTVAANDQHLEFSVADTGIGIRAADIDRLFDPFEQADATTTRLYGGTGLGLSISRRLAGLLGGTLTAASEFGAGSEFRLRIPLIATAVPSEAEVTPHTVVERPLAGLRVLAAEDNALSRVVLEDALLAYGAEVTTAENGLRAVDIVEREGGDRFDIVLMDVQMPELDGFEATRRILARAPQLPVLGQTAHAHEEEHARCRQSGMVDVVTKPLDFERLAAVVARYARNRNQ